MGNGFSILIWDSWGAGLVRINARLLDDGTKDMYGNSKNWWAYNSEDDRDRKVAELTKNIEYFKIIE